MKEKKEKLIKSVEIAFEIVGIVVLAPHVLDPEHNLIYPCSLFLLIK